MKLRAQYTIAALAIGISMAQAQTPPPTQLYRGLTGEGFCNPSIP